MEVYVLDDLFRRETVIDKFESLIWTERLSAWGDFELILYSNSSNRKLFQIGKRLAMNESYRVMVIETVEDKTDSEGKSNLIVKGRSLEAILDDRLAASTISATPQPGRWILIGTATEIARKVFHDICIEGTLSTADILPIIEGSLFPQSTVSEPTEILTIFAEPRSVYLGIKDLCELYNMGFRILRDFDTSNLYFDVYMGSDRTSRQDVHPAVIFSPDLENLQNTTEFKTIENYKNVAYVYGPTATAIYIPVNVDPDISGFDRKVLYVRADDIDDPDPEFAELLLLLRGRSQLGNFQAFAGYDGELNRNIEYKYDIDYFLGDLVEMQSLDGSISILQVTEQIFVSDAEGERTYPTLSLNQFIMQGTWLAWDYDEEWSDMTDEEWEDVP
jgi:Siphovirus ReqiPepy6 Gp37-like protein